MKKIKPVAALLLSAIIFISAIIPVSAQVTATETPVNAEETRLKWSLKIGSGYRDAPSVPTADGNFVFVMSRNKLYKISADSGEIIQSVQMASEPSFSYTPVTVADGKIFCPLENGIIQAFDKETMNSLWVSSDPLGGQALTRAVFYDGLLYTGFWNDEELDANFVCLDAQTGETKWSCTRKGGFYWAECFVNGSFAVAGGDNGSADNEAAGSLVCFNRLTGEITDTAEIIGDQRSGIAEDNGNLFFVTKAGYFCKIPLTSGGKFGNPEFLKLSGASTSTPTVCKGRAYIGVQQKGFSGSINIIDINTMSVIRDIPSGGYPQSELLISTAYEDEGGKVLIYSTYNSPPGGISVITDGANIDAPSTEQLFVPETAAQGYCISPIAVGDDGTLFYKNDSGTVFALEKAEKKEPAEKSFFDRLADWFKNIFTSIIGFFTSIIKIFTNGR